jgi:hypothetical protein
VKARQVLHPGIPPSLPGPRQSFCDRQSRWFAPPANLQAASENLSQKAEISLALVFFCTTLLSRE